MSFASSNFDNIVAREGVHKGGNKPMSITLVYEAHIDLDFRERVDDSERKG